MSNDELATAILELLDTGGRTCEDLFQTWPEESPARVEAAVERLVQAGLLTRSDHEPATAGLTDAGIELLVEAHTAAAMPATAIKAAVVGRTITERTQCPASRAKAHASSWSTPPTSTRASRPERPAPSTSSTARAPCMSAGTTVPPWA